MRIAVVGSSGAGKSTLARHIAERLHLPLIHLDQAYWGPGWTEPPRAEWRGRIAELAARPEWVMEGNYGSTWDTRIPRAHAVVWLDIPRRVCLAGVIGRVLRHWGRTRPDLAPGCVERFDWAFMKYIWRYPKDGRPKTLRMLEGLRADQRVFVLRSRAEFPELLNALERMPGRAA